jgi:hypothetical protein
VTQVVLATGADKHEVEVTEADWAVVLELVPVLPILGQEIAVLHILNLML